MRTFYVSSSAAPNADYPIECSECYYEFGMAREERPSGRVEYTPVIPPGVRLRARDEFIDEFKRNLVSNKYRLENFTHDLPKS